MKVTEEEIREEAIRTAAEYIAGKNRESRKLKALVLALALALALTVAVSFSIIKEQGDVIAMYSEVQSDE